MYFARKCWVWLKRWLRKEPANTFEIVVLIIRGTTYMLLAALVGMSFLLLLNNLFRLAPALTYFLPAAFIEEMLFRWLPLFVPLIIWGKKQKTLPILIFIAVVASFLFGIAHGHLYNLAIQGAGGFVLSLFFIKCSFKSGQYAILQPRALMVTTLSHFLYNMLILLV